MNVTYDFTNIENYSNVCFEFASAADFPDGEPPLGEGWRPKGDGVFQRVAPISAALGHAAMVIGLREINKQTFFEWLYRLECAVDAGISLLTIADDTCLQCGGRKIVLVLDDDPLTCGECNGSGHNAAPRLVPYRFTFKDVHAHLGLTVLEAVNYDNIYFDSHIRSLRAERIEKQVRKEVEQLELEDQPTTPPTLGSGT